MLQLHLMEQIKLVGVNASVGLSTEGQSVTFIYTDSTQGWIEHNGFNF